MLKTARHLLPFLIFSFIFITVVHADELLDVQNEINQKNQEYSQTQADIAAIKNEIAALSGSVYSTQEELDAANEKVAKIRKKLAKAEEDLDQKKNELQAVVNVRDQQIRYLYKHPGNSALELFVISDGFENFTQMLGFQKKVVGTSKDLIAIINVELTKVQETRDDIAEATSDLEKIASSISSQLASLQGQLYYQSGQQSYLSNQLVQIQSDLSSLTAKQKKLIAEKLAAANRRQTVGDTPPASEPLPNPGFSPAYVFLTYGYPHRVGMNQYGAYGRAKAGQGYKQILKAYYRGVSVGKYPTPSKIKVAGYGSISLEGKYLRGISEMPRSWSMEALKAQAVAARTYALRWIQANPGGSICTTQACQVYRASSANCNGTYNRRWCNAVDATRGVVITYGGSLISAWYSSTSGGYTLSSQEVWGSSRPYAKGIKDFGPKGAYDGPKYGNSPWYHTFWNGKHCTGAFPWLKKREVTDLFNAAILSQVSSSYNQHLSQNPACPGRTPGWSATKVANKLKSMGKKDVGSLSNIIVAFDGRGHTSSVTFVSNKYPSGKTFSGSFFASIFNLRSPGNLVIMTSLYDVLIK
jgi:peptidoglycan hydrolase-like amidase